MTTNDGSSLTITKRLRNLLQHRRRSAARLPAKVTLEKVLGLTTVGNSGLACDPHSGLVAYPAGCVVVLLNPKKNRQQHLINTSRKTITALAFSPDGKYLVTGESGHLPAVRVWEVSSGLPVAELQKHGHGVSCVVVSPDGRHVVSVGTQHDMTVSVWAWKKGVVVAVNKVSSKVMAVSFSEDSSYFVTAGTRHLKFWYLEPCKPTKASSAVPLLGRSGLLGELRNSSFCDVACGRGSSAGSTFCVSSTGLLCEFNSRRTLDKWVDLRTGVAQSLSLSEDIIFCGGADGTVRCFSPVDLCFLATLPRPHPLGTAVTAVTRASSLLSNNATAATPANARYPDTVAVTYDPASRWLSCVYADHSVYVWDVRDVRRVGKVHSALYHAASVWDLQTFPDVSGGESNGVPSASTFFSCSADSTVRQWCTGGLGGNRHNALSGDLLSVIYTDESAADGNTTSTTAGAAAAALLDTDGTAAGADGATGENRTGIRSICVSPDGKHLASGDRNGMLRVHDLRSMTEILKIDAHDAEILCLEYSKPETGLSLLASSSRDRLIHVFDAAADYALLQTLDDHSSSIPAVRFAANDNNVRLISCGADKSIYFRTAHMTGAGPEFRRSHHIVGKTTVYDMTVEPTCKYTAVGCQDRTIRIFNISSGKQKKLYKGSVSEDGSLLKVQMDPSGLYIATSCSDKNISIFDFHTGECVATMFGHSEIVTGMKFTNDCKHLISVSGDSCIFIWRLSAELSLNMRQRLRLLRHTPGASPSPTRGGSGGPTPAGLSSDSDREREEDEVETETESHAHPDHVDAPDDPDDADEDSLSNASSTTDDFLSSNGEEEAGVSEPVQAWGSPNKGDSDRSPESPVPARRPPRRRWSHWAGSPGLTVKSMLDLRQLDSFSPDRSAEPAPRTRAAATAGSTSSLQEALQSEEKARRRRPWQRQGWPFFFPSSKGPKGPDGGDGGRQASVPVARGRPRGWTMGSGTSQQGDNNGGVVVTRGYHHSCGGSIPNLPSQNFAGVTPIPPDSSEEEAEEDEEGEEEETREREKAGVPSVDEALWAVCEPPPDHQRHQDFLRRNFETLVDQSSGVADLGEACRLSMSSRFLALGRRIRSAPLLAKARGGNGGGNGEVVAPAPPPPPPRPPPPAPAPPTQEEQPPMSRVRPMVDGVVAAEGRGHKTPRSEVSGVPDAGAPVGASQLHAGPQRKRNVRVLRLAHPPLGDVPAALHKSQSVQNLLSRPTLSLATSSGGAAQLQGESGPDSLCPPLASPLSRSAPSCLSPPLPWESPRTKAPPPPPRSYMSPTTSFMAKCTRATSSSSSSSFPPPPLPGEELLPGSPRLFFPPPPRSPCPPALRRGSLDKGGASSSCSSSSTTSSSSSPERSTSSSYSYPCPGSPPRSPTLVPPTVTVTSPNRPSALALSAPPPASRIPVPRQPMSPRRSLGPASDWSAGRTNRGSPTSPATGGPLSQAPPPLLASRPENSVTLETCRQAAGDLHNSLQRMATLYSLTLSGSSSGGGGGDADQDQAEMRKVLSEALGVARAQLDALPSGAPPGEGPPGPLVARLEADRAALALLQQYSELLLRSVEKRMDGKT